MTSSTARPKVAVCSHRRSGTHLTIDTIINNFSAFATAEIITADEFGAGRGHHTTPDAFLADLQAGQRVVKQHLLPDPALHYEAPDRQAAVQHVFDHLPLIYVCRDGRDVMVSLYNYMKRFRPDVEAMPFAEFLRTEDDFTPGVSGLSRPAFWAYHVRQYQALATEREILFLRYRDFHADYAGCVRRIGDHLGLPVPENIRPTLMTATGTAAGRLWAKFRNKYLRGNRSSAVQFNKGTTGDYVNYFDAADLAFFEQEAGEVAREMGFIT